MRKLYTLILFLLKNNLDFLHILIIKYYTLIIILLKRSLLLLLNSLRLNKILSLIVLKR